MPGQIKRITWTPDVINRFREDHRFTMATFGRALGTTGEVKASPHKNTVWMWESGRTRPSASAQRALDALAAREFFDGAG
jgi:DNA-binding transcriptional regulator YiaG